MKRKLFRIILTLCMASSLFLWNSISANATKTIHTDVIDDEPKSTEDSSEIPIHNIAIKTPEVIAGNTAVLETIEFYSGTTLIDNENFDVEASWVSETDNYNDVTGMIFEDGHVYQLRLCIKPHSGYYLFNEISITHNSETKSVTNVTPTHYDYIYYETLLPPVQTIELSGLPSVEIGETMVESLEILSNLDDVDCQLSIEWWNENGEDSTGQVMEAGHIYTIQISVDALSQYPLSDDFVFIIDGTEYKPTKLDDLNKRPYQAWLELEYNFSNYVNADDYANDPGADADADTNIDIDENNAVSPKTSDSSMMMLYSLLSIISIGIIVFIRRKNI